MVKDQVKPNQVDSIGAAQESECEDSEGEEEDSTPNCTQSFEQLIIKQMVSTNLMDLSQTNLTMLSHVYPWRVWAVTSLSAPACNTHAESGFFEAQKADDVELPIYKPAEGKLKKCTGGHCPVCDVT